MSPRPARRRSGAVALTCAGLTLSAGALGAVGGSATAAPAGPTAAPVSDCAEPFPVADVAKGDAVTGLTVVSGTEPVGFTGEVLGVLTDGIAPDIDMIMIDLDMPAFDETGGVWQGMSGSPVYAADGRLIGAVAYGLSYGPSTIAGITPYAFMDDYLGSSQASRSSEAARSSKAMSSAQTRLVAQRAGVTERQAAQGFRSLPMPLGVSGISARRLAQSQDQDRGSKYLDSSTYVVGRAGADVAGPETIVAGGNLAASASYGDITLAGVGTATSVCDGEVVGFGHPLFGVGETTEGLHSADAIYVQPDSLGAPFKVANVGPVAGTITQDRLTGISGVFGDAPAAATVTSTVTSAEDARTGSSEVTVPEALPDVTFYQLLANIDRVVGGNPEGTAVHGWTVTGDDDGTPFELSFDDRYTGGDLIYDPVFQLADLTYSLAGIDGVTVEQVTSDLTLSDDESRLKVGGVEQLVRGSWVAVSREAPVRASAGDAVKLRITLKGVGEPRTVRIPDLVVPKRAEGRARLYVQGGATYYSYFYGSSIKQLQKRIDEAVRHDEVVVTLGSRGSEGPRGGGYDVEYRPSASSRPSEDPGTFSLTRTLGAFDHVVDGRARIPVTIK